MNKNLNFATTIRRSAILGHHHQSRGGGLEFHQAQADKLRWKVRQTLERAKPPKSNITKLERLVTGSLQRNENIFILPADKGNATVVMDKSDYTRKLEDLISNGSYSKVKKDPTMKTECKLLLIKNKDHFAPKTYRQLLQCYTKLTHIYSLPKKKKKKKKTKMRTIVKKNVNNLLFFCVLSILTLIWLVLMVLFCAAIRRDSVSLLRFPFLSHVQVCSFEMSLVSHLKYLYSCFSSHFCFCFLVISVLLILMLSVLFLVAVIIFPLHFSMQSLSQHCLQC